MARKKEKVVTLKIPIKRRCILQAYSNNGDIMPGLSNHSEEQFEIMKNLIEWINTYAPKKFPAKVRQNMHHAEMLHNILETVYTLVRQHGRWKIIVDQYEGVFLIGPSQELGSFGNLEVKGIYQLKGVDDALYELSCGLLHVMWDSYGYQFLEDTEYYELTKDSLEDRVKYEREDIGEEGVEACQAALDELNDEKYKTVIKDIRNSTYTRETFLERVNKIHLPDFPKDKPNGMIANSLYQITIRMKILNGPFNPHHYGTPWGDDEDYDSENGTKVRTGDRYSIMWSYDDDLWPEISTWIDDTFNNIGEETMAYHFNLLKDGFPTEHDWILAEDLCLKVDYFNNLVEELRELINSPELFYNYVNLFKNKKDGNHYQKVLTKGSSLCAALSV